MAGTILVVGATGNTASGLIPTLAARGATVRALAHSEEKADALRAQGVGTIVGDLDEPETLATAVRGVEKIYLITWNGPTAVQQVENVLAAAKQAGRPHIVRQSAFGPPSSRIIGQHQQIDAIIEASGLSYTFIAPTFFMQNLMMAASTVASDGMIYFPMRAGRLAMVDIRDLIDTAAAVLTSEGHEGKRYTVTGPQAVSFSEVAGALSSALGRPVTYVDVPGEAAKQSMLGMGVPEWIVDGYIELFGGFSQNFADRVSPDVERITGHAGRSVQQFATDFAPHFSGVTAATTAG